MNQEFEFSNHLMFCRLLAVVISFICQRHAFGSLGLPFFALLFLTFAPDLEAWANCEDTGVSPRPHPSEGEIVDCES